MSKNLLLVKPGFMKPAERKRLREADIIVIETSDFEAFKLINAEILVGSDDFAIAALEIIHEKVTNEHFASKVMKIMKAKRGIAEPSK